MLNESRNHRKIKSKLVFGIIPLKTTLTTILLLSLIRLILTNYILKFHVPYWNDEASEMRPSNDYVVPNIVHFIRFGNATLTFIDAVCILAALKNQKPRELFIHSDQKEFNGGKYWRVVIEHPLARGVVQVKYLPQPKDIYGQPFSKRWGLYHKSDVERLRVLMKYGGMYCDNDLYIARSLNRFRFYEMTLGWEMDSGISDQVIIASKDARFLKVWLESYMDYRADRWFWNGGELPTLLLKKRPYLVHRQTNWLAEYKKATSLIYYHNDGLWKAHFAIHLLVRQQWQKQLLPFNLSATATYPVLFNETNILHYEANIKYMALDVYPKVKRKRQSKHNRKTIGRKVGEIVY